MYKNAAWGDPWMCTHVTHNWPLTLTTQMAWFSHHDYGIVTVLLLIINCGHCVKLCTTIHCYSSSTVSSREEIVLSALPWGTWTPLSSLWINGANKWSLATSFRVNGAKIYSITLPPKHKKNKSSEQMWESIKRAFKASDCEHHINLFHKQRRKRRNERQNEEIPGKIPW